MDLDQFGGRTDDDLFADDIEPLPYEGEVDTPATTTAEPVQAATPQPPAPDATPAPANKAPTPKGLSNSIHNRPDRSHASKNTQNYNQNQSVSASWNTSQPTPPSSLPQKSPAAKSQAQRTNNAASILSEARAKSGGVLPQKLSKAESDKMLEEKRLAAAKRTQRYEREKNDEEQHAIAYAKGLQEALRRKEDAARREEAEKHEKARKQEEMLKRKQEDAARRKAAMGEKNKYEADREQNKGRKGTRAPWDEGKVDLDQPDTFTKGANGGVRGSTRSGLGGSRFASEGESHGFSHGANAGGKQGRRDHGRKLLELENSNGRTRNEHHTPPLSTPRTTATAQKPKAAEEFPALPSSGPVPTTTIASPTWVKPVGDWAEDVEG